MNCTRVKVLAVMTKKAVSIILGAGVFCAGLYTGRRGGRPEHHARGADALKRCPDRRGAPPLCSA